MGRIGQKSAPPYVPRPGEKTGEELVVYRLVTKEMNEMGLKLTSIGVLRINSEDIEWNNERTELQKDRRPAPSQNPPRMQSGEGLVPIFGIWDRKCLALGVIHFSGVTFAQFIFDLNFVSIRAYISMVIIIIIIIIIRSSTPVIIIYLMSTKKVFTM